jgi:hypothetical protein
MEVNPQALCEVQYAPGPASSKRPKAQRQPQAVVPEAQAHSSSAGAPSSSGPQTAVKRIKLNTTDQTYLDAYYYADMPGNSQSIIEDMDANFNVKVGCDIIKYLFCYIKKLLISISFNI